jgi:hypothetical protein
MVNEIKIENLYISIGLHAAIILIFVAIIFIIEKKDLRDGLIDVKQ